MFYESDLQFLCDTFRRSRIHISTVGLDEPVSRVVDNELEQAIDKYSHKTHTLREYLGTVEPKTIYKLTDSFKFCYIYFLLPGMPQDTMLFIGPFVSSPLSSRQILEIGEKLGLSPKQQKMLDGYYFGIPVIPDNSHLYMMIETFGDRIWGGSSEYTVVDLARERSAPPSPINTSGSGEDLDSTLVNMKLIEKRYKFENDFMKAVSLGHSHKADFLISSLTEPNFEKRTTDPLRNIKNYSIIMNTLLRKAAENGGVHPVYIDKVSSAFAMKIEQLPALADSRALMNDMFRSYCQLVRKHSLKGYSLTVQKAIVLIESDLSSNLTLSSVAQTLNVSSGYLSSVFRRETGKTLTEFVQDKRIKHAMHLLSTTHLQVQTIAVHCGIMDVQYFTKTFKKRTGKTPKEYRESVK